VPLVALLVAAKVRGRPWRLFLVGAIASVALLAGVMVADPPG
jgi:hypothetical protein